MEPTLAAVDIGSNSIKMTVARRQTDGTLRELAWRSEVVRLGAGIDQSGRLADDRVAAALATLGRFATDAKRLGASRLIGVATEAVRVAANGPSFLDRVRREFGIEVSIIGGEREAELSFRGLAASVDLSGEVIVADIGGGSTEIIVAREGQMAGTGSVPVGSGRLTDRFVVEDPPTTAELEHCRESALTALRPLQATLVALPGALVRMILVGGTGEYLGRMAPDSSRILPTDVAMILRRCTEMTAAMLAAELQIPEARARVLPAGFAVVAALIDLVAPRAIGVGQSGIRTGLLLEAFAEMTGKPGDGSAP
ncbi:MAG: hypothetical protein M3464_04730 [Chloroflexota bacterium]|nr:hypothetical protein [Chloroflexota bacterium]